MAKDKSQDYIIRMAAEAGTKAALEAYAKEKEKEKKRRSDRRLRDTKRLMKNYREIKIHASDAVTSLAEVENEDYDFFRRLMENEHDIDVDAIVSSKAKSAIMLAHIDAMLSAYQTICVSSKRPEDERRYRVLEAMYLGNYPSPAPDIAERENIDVRTVYKDLDAACEKMSALLFGIQWIERE